VPRQIGSFSGLSASSNQWGLDKMYRWFTGALKVLLIGALIAVQPAAIALADYAMTLGVGTNFGSIIVGGVHYAQGLLCDQTTVVRCVGVDAAGGATVKGEGTAGTPTGGVVTVQGVTSMTPIIATGSGTAGTAATGVQTIQGIASMTPVLAAGAGTAGSASGGVLSVNVVSNTGFPTPQADPCGSSANVKQTADFVSPVSGGSIITATPGAKAYICSISIVTSATANVSLLEGTGASVCTGGSTGGVFMNSGVTVASGAAFAPNSGISVGTGGYTIAKNTTANQNICVAFTTTNSPQVNAHVTYVQQ
jgi:hypothetical protein